MSWEQHELRAWGLNTLHHFCQVEPLCAVGQQLAHLLTQGLFNKVCLCRVGVTVVG